MTYKINNNNWIWHEKKSTNTRGTKMSNLKNNNFRYTQEKISRTSSNTPMKLRSKNGAKKMAHRANTPSPSVHTVVSLVNSSLNLSKFRPNATLATSLDVLHALGKDDMIAGGSNDVHDFFIAYIIKGTGQLPDVSRDSRWSILFGVLRSFAHFFISKS